MKIEAATPPHALALPDLRTPKPLLPLRSLGLEALRQADSGEQLRQACQRFEGFLLAELLKLMRHTEVTHKGLLPVSRAERIFIHQQCEALGEALAPLEPLGIARLLYQALSAPLPGRTSPDFQPVRTTQP